VMEVGVRAGLGGSGDAIGVVEDPIVADGEGAGREGVKEDVGVVVVNVSLVGVPPASAFLSSSARNASRFMPLVAAVISSAVSAKLGSAESPHHMTLGCS
ncbi:unnamed protein product, partial [Symbiodinium necroappetens]